MKRLHVVIACMIACMAFLSGCTKSNIVQPKEETKVGNPDFDIKDGVQIDWEQVSTDADSMFEDKTDYPYSEKFHFMLEPNKKEVMLVWTVSDDFPDTEIRNYAEIMIKKFNDVVATQDFSIEQSSETSYGGLWKNYGLSFSIVPVSSPDDENSWFISGNYAAGTEFDLPDIDEAIRKANEAPEAQEPAPAEEEEAEGTEEETN